MKKFLAILLLLSMLCASFVACTGGEGEGTTPTTDPAGDAATIEDAVEYLTSMYKSDEGKKTPADYLLIAQVPIGDVKFEVTWTVDLEGIEIVLENGTYTVKLPSKNETETPYTLTATVKDAEGKTEVKTFGRVLPVYDNSAAVTDPQEGEVYKLFMVQANVGKTLFLTNKSQNNENKYILSSATPAEGAEFMVEKADGGVKIYTTIDGVKTYVYAHTTTAADGKISKYVGFSAENSSVFTYQANVNAWFTKCDGIDYVFGTYSSYETACISESSYITPENTGLSQFVVAFMNKDAADAFVPDETPKDPTELTSIKDILAIGEKLEHNTNTVEKYLVKGEITEIVKEDYGNMYIKDAEGNTLYIYGLYSKDGSVRYDAMTDKPQVGDTITVMSQVCNYKGPQLKNATLQKHEKPGAGTTDGLAAVKPAPGTAYRFAFIQKNVDNKVFYITGILNGYYMDTTETASKGADVYVEETTGGFYLYCTVNGAKSYINMVQSGNYTNAKFEAAATTVYTYDETLKTVVGTVDGKSFVLGTKADGTYTTLGPMASDSGCMYAQFVAIPAGGENTGSTEAEKLEAVKPAAGTAYKFGFVQGNANKTLYITGAMNGYYMDTTEDKASAVDVYVEETTGGFYLYCMVNGTKTYINMVQSGTHTNGKFEATATTVYTYDETLKTVVGTVEGKTFIFGTRADGTYTTIGPMASDSSCFHAVFVK